MFFQVTFLSAGKRAFRENQRRISEKDWEDLHVLSHLDKKEAFRKYVGHYLSTSGQVYWSDSMQLSSYISGYHAAIDRVTGKKGSEMITEIYVPLQSLALFMHRARDCFLRSRASVVYGTVRLIERDRESFMPWAKRRYACVIFNLHVDHNAESIEKNRRVFRRLISIAIGLKGSYFLTYHRYASKRQVESCYPEIREFVKLKKKFDPGEKFQSEWYRHLKKMFGLK